MGVAGSRLVYDLPAVCQNFKMATELVVDGSVQMSDTVHVLDLDKPVSEKY